MEALPVELLPLITSDARSWVMMSRTNRAMAAQMRKMIYSYTAGLHFDCRAINTRAYIIVVNTVLDSVYFIYDNGKEVFFATHTNMMEREMIIHYMFGRPTILNSVASADVLFAVGIFDIKYKPVKLTHVLPGAGETSKIRGGVPCKKILSSLKFYQKDIVLSDTMSIDTTEAPHHNDVLMWQRNTRFANTTTPQVKPPKKSNNVNTTPVGVLTQQGQSSRGVINFHDGHTLGTGDIVVIVEDKPVMSTLRGREILRRLPQLAGHIYDIEPLFADEW